MSEESGLSAGGSGELHAAVVGNAFAFHEQNLHDHVNLLLDFLIKLVGHVELEFHLVFVFAGLVLDLVLIEIIDERLLDHIGVVSREELGVVGVHLLVFFHVLLWFAQSFIRRIELHGILLTL